MWISLLNRLGEQSYVYIQNKQLSDIELLMVKM